MAKETWKIYRKDVEGTAARASVLTVQASSRREALDLADDHFGPASRGWLYAVSERQELAVASLPSA